MELEFVETIEGKEWEAEFEAHSDFNLHLERVNGGSLVVSQRGTASGEYAAAFAKGMYEGQAVIDYDFGALVYPKWIKVVSGSEVVSASVNFNEGGGSGSGSGSGESIIQYYKFKPDLLQGDPIDIEIAGMFVFQNDACSVKIKAPETMIVSYSAFQEVADNLSELIAFSFSPQTLYTTNSNKEVVFRYCKTIEEFVSFINEALSINYTIDAITNFESITESEFYNLEA